MPVSLLGLFSSEASLSGLVSCSCIPTWSLPTLMFIVCDDMLSNKLLCKYHQSKKIHLKLYSDTCSPSYLRG